MSMKDFNKSLYNSSSAGGLSGGMNVGGQWKVEQDVTPFLEQAKRDREAYFANESENKKKGLRKFATIPDVVALDIKEKHGLDLHSAEFNSDPANLAKLRLIIIQDYPHLMSSTS